MVKKSLLAKAAIFDMDGVITNTMPYHFKAWEMAFKDIVGMSISEKDIYLREGSKGSFALEEIFEQYGWAYHPSVLKKLLARKEEIFPQIVKVDFVDGAVQFLRAIHDQGFVMALVTGTSRDELKRMLPEHIQLLFSVIVTGTDVVHGKPNPEPYQAALTKLNVSCDEAFVIENAPLGIRSARAAGLRCIALETSLERAYLADADYVFLNFDELIETLSFKCVS